MIFDICTFSVLYTPFWSSTWLISEKKCFIFWPTPKSRCVFWNNTCYHVAACVSPFYLICSMTIFNKWIFDLLLLPKGLGCMLGQNACFQGAHETWLISRWKCVDLLTPFLSGQWCLCVLNNCYHVAVMCCSLNFICSMTIFRISFILDSPHPLNLPRGSDPGIQSNIQSDIFHIYCCFFICLHTKFR